MESTPTLALAAPPEEEAAEPVIIARARAPKYGLAADVVNRGISRYPDDVRRELRFLDGYCRDGDFALREVAPRIIAANGEPYSPDSLYQSLTGRREAGMDLIAAAIRDLRLAVGEAAPALDVDFIETEISQACFRVYAMARKKHRLSYIFGESQIGKSVAAAEWTRLHNHGETRLVRVPTRASFRDFIEELARTLRIPDQHCQSDVKRRIIESFSPDHLLIVDEAEQVLLSSYAGRSLAVLEFIREIWDRRKCGVVIQGAYSLQRELATNPTLVRLWRRRPNIHPLVLPAVPGPKALACFAAAYGLDPAPDRTITVEVKSGGGAARRLGKNPLELQNTTVRRDGLGVWCRLLEDARERAREDGRPLTWGRVIHAHAVDQALQDAAAGGAS